MRVTMDAKVNDSNRTYTDGDYYSPRTPHRISVATKRFSGKIIVHRVQGYSEVDIAASRVELPDFAAFLLEFTDYDEVRLARWHDA